ncbi:MAG: immunoglobulin domain-containing protein, partial [Opitutaceae bacterium]
NLITIVVKRDSAPGALPVIIKEPVGLKVNRHNDVAFEVVATGKPAPTYQWLSGGVAIDGATSSTLALNSVVKNASYSVIVSNPSGSVVSRTADLVIIEPADSPKVFPPVITTQPTDSMANISDPIRFFAAASGTPEPAYQWRKNGGNISGATSASFALASVSASDAGYYSVVATNIAGSVVSSAAKLSVAIPPAITSQPANQVVADGSEVTFQIVATGFPAPTFQWQKNGVDLGGATTATLHLSAISRTDGGTYTVTATNVAGSVMSNKAVLTIQVQDPDRTAVESPPPEPAVSVVQSVNSLLRLKAGEKAFAKFEVMGDAPRRILVRAVGPTLAKFGAADVLADPQVELYQGGGVLARNDNWGGGTDLIEAFNQAGATPFTSVESKDAAILTTLTPGIYLLIVSAVDGLGGAVLLEAYELP